MKHQPANKSEEKAIARCVIFVPKYQSMKNMSMKNMKNMNAKIITCYYKIWDFMT